MDDFDELRASEFVTDTDDQESLDERIESEQSLRNQQLWISFQNAACCITKLYKDRAQPNVSLWIPFQNAASNLTTLYKDCIESQRRFAKIGYQIGKRRRKRTSKSNILHRRSHSSQPRHLQASLNVENGDNQFINSTFGAQANGTATLDGQSQQQPAPTGVASLLAVNQLSLNCDELPSHSMQSQAANALIDQQQYPQHTIIDKVQHLSSNHNNHSHQDYHHPIQSATQHLQHQSGAQVAPMSNNNEDNLVTFQQALVQPAVIRSIKQSGQNHNGNNISNRSSNISTPSYLTKSEEDRLMELNRFLAEEYQRHVGSRKRSCSAIGGNMAKRVRE